MNLVKPNSIANKADVYERLKRVIALADAIIIGAGAGLSTAGGFSYTGERFRRYFCDFEAKYQFHDMYSGGFCRYDTPEEKWGYWSRHIYINRYMTTPKPVYQNLLELVKDKDYFVITTNVDHCFQKAGFDKERLYYMQGDMGLWQCSKPCHQKTYDNEEVIRKMVLSQGFTIAENGDLTAPSAASGGTDFSRIRMYVDSNLIPHCPVCGRPMSMNLRIDHTFVEDKGWYQAAERYDNFLRRHEGMRILFLELGIGMNTPVIIKYPFWQMCAGNQNAVYACINYGEAYCPREIESRSICIDADIAEALQKLKAGE